MSDSFPIARLIAAWKAKRRVLLLLLLAGTVAGALWGALRPRWYEAQATLVVRRTAALDVAPNERPDMADYPTLLANRVVAQEMVVAHDLGRWKIDAVQLLQLVRIREVRDTALLLLSVTLPDPAVAQAVANHFATRATEFNKELNNGDVIRARDTIKGQLDEAKAELRQAEARLLDHRSSAQVEVKRADSKAKLEAREELVELTSELAAERQRLIALERQMNAVPETTAGPRAAGAEQELAEQVREFDETREVRKKQEPGTLEPERRDMPAWPRTEGTVNPVRQLLAYQVSATRARVAAMEGRLRDLSGRHHIDGKVLPELLALYRGEVQLTRFELERDIAARAVTELAAQYEQARLKVASRVPSLQVVDAAVVPSRPVPPGIAVTTMIGFLLGLLAGLLTLVPAVVGLAWSADGDTQGR
jgi:uncharacterized protein involved in exopolysaccharide biosynthesis